MIISRTPVRLSFFGGGTDYPVFFETFGGAVLGATIDKFVYVSVNRLSEFFDYKVRISYSKAELVNTIDEIVHPSVRETLKYRRTREPRHPHLRRPASQDRPRLFVGVHGRISTPFTHLSPKQRLAEEASDRSRDDLRERRVPGPGARGVRGLNLIEFRKEGSRSAIVISKAKYDYIDDSLMVFTRG
jgi:D-glycero-alpha-D-manno-heptose-7-phosphate kinase